MLGVKNEQIRGSNNKRTRGLEAPDECNIFNRNVPWIFEPSQFFVNIDGLKMATKSHEDGAPPKTRFYGYLQGIARPVTFNCLATISFISIFFYGQ